MTAQTTIQDIKQCVIIADSFSSEFSSDPIFFDFNSTKIIQFNLNWLAQNSVKQVIIAYIKSKIEIQKLVADLDSKDMKITLMYCEPEQNKTMGDIMRELYFQQILNNDFLLVAGNIISNLSLKDLWRQHLARKQLSSKQNILTVALENTNNNQTYVLNNLSKQILQIHDFNKKFSLNHQRIKLSDGIENLSIRGNLSQAGIYACSLQVIKGFKETFEHQSLNDFINGILTSELYSEKIFCYILKNNQKCTLIQKPYDYYTAYQHLLNRYYYPFLVDRSPQFLRNRTNINTTYLDYNKYIKARVPIRSIKISHNIYIGEQGNIEAGASLFKTIVCRNATIGANADLKYCLVAQGAVVPENYKANYCYIRGKGDSLQALSWQSLTNIKLPELESVELFPEDIEQGQNFDDDLKIILSEVPSSDTYKQVSSLRKEYNKTCRQFVNAMIYNLVPSSKERVLKIVREWGEMIRKVSIESSQLLFGLADACVRQQQYQSLFPYFLRFFYQQQHLSDVEIVSWYDENKNVQQWSTLMKQSSNLVDKLRQDDQQDQDQDQDN